MPEKETDMEKLRRELVDEIKKAGEEGPLSGERLVKLSKRLDEMIIRYMKGRDRS